MLRRLLTGGLIGGCIGGLLIAAVETVTTTPLILQAEAFEASTTAGAAASTLYLGTEIDGSSGFSRTTLTVLATVGLAIGYAWILLAAMHIADRPITWRSIVPWAVGGFLATGLAPAFDIAPMLPGSSEAGLEGRQLWWCGTAIATASGLTVLAFGRRPYALALGLALIALPHVTAVPWLQRSITAASPVPAELAASFATASLGLQFLIWVVPAAIAGYAVSRFGDPSTAR